MSEVNAKNMARWIVALRSGKYKQGRQYLRIEDAMCCMGVACDISGLGQWGSATSQGFTDSVFSYDVLGSRWKPGMCTAVLTEEVRDWLGLDEVNPSVLDGDEESCGDLNDGKRWSFNQIADALEERYLNGRKAEEILSGVSSDV